jgi:hypothetical protein
MTTITPALLLLTVDLGAADANVYSPGTNTSGQIGRAVFCNTAASAITITAGITSGGALGVLTMINARTLAPGETYVSPELAGVVIPTGYQLHAFASVAGSVTLTVSGVVIQ